MMMLLFLFIFVLIFFIFFFFFFSSRRRHTRSLRDWSSDVCSSDLMLHRAIAMTVVLTHVMADGGVKLFPLLQDLTAASPVAVADTWLRISNHIEIGRASCREKSVDLGGRRIITKKE